MRDFQRNSKEMCYNLVFSAASLCLPHIDKHRRCPAVPSHVTTTYFRVFPATLGKDRSSLSSPASFVPASAPRSHTGDNRCWPPPNLREASRPEPTGDCGLCRGSPNCFLRQFVLYWRALQRNSPRRTQGYSPRMRESGAIAVSWGWLQPIGTGTHSFYLSRSTVDFCQIVLHLSDFFFLIHFSKLLFSCQHGSAFAFRSLNSFN